MNYVAEAFMGKWRKDHNYVFQYCKIILGNKGFFRLKFVNSSASYSHSYGPVSGTGRYDVSGTQIL